MNTTDWWRTVKLPFVKEKQEPSCVRPSLRGWEETAGRKPRLQSGTQRLSCRLRAHCRLHWFGLLTPVGGGGRSLLHSASLLYTHVSKSYHKRGCVSVCFFLRKTKISCTVVPTVAPSPLLRRSTCTRGGVLGFIASYNKLCIYFPPPAMEIAWSQSSKKKRCSTIWFMNQFKYRSKRLVMHEAFLSALVRFQIN